MSVYGQPDYESGGNVLKFDEEVMQSAYLEEVGREHLRPPKRNNVKRKVPEQRKFEIAQREKAERERKCPHCKANYDGSVLDERSREVVCGSCGSVLSMVFDVGVHDAERLRKPVVTDPPANYFNERMAQWRCQEPPIPLVDRARLVETYNQGYGPYTSRTAVSSLTPRAVALLLGLVYVRVSGAVESSVMVASLFGVAEGDVHIPKLVTLRLLLLAVGVCGVHGLLPNPSALSLGVISLQLPYSPAKTLLQRTHGLLHFTSSCASPHRLRRCTKPHALRKTKRP